MCKAELQISLEKVESCRMLFYIQQDSNFIIIILLFHLVLHTLCLVLDVAQLCRFVCFIAVFFTGWLYSDEIKTVIQ